MCYLLWLSFLWLALAPLINTGVWRWGCQTGSEDGGPGNSESAYPAVCGLSVPCSRGSHHLLSHSNWEGQPCRLNPDPAQTPDPDQRAYAGVGMCLIKKQAHDSQPCNYGYGPGCWALILALSYQERL